VAEEVAGEEEVVAVAVAAGQVVTAATRSCALNRALTPANPYLACFGCELFRVETWDYVA